MTSRPDWWLERVALGDMPGADLSDLTEEERGRYDALLASNQAILAKYPLTGVRTEVARRHRLTAAKRRRPRWVIGLLPAIAVAATAVVVAPVEGPTERMKGEARLVIHKKTPDGVLQVRNDDVLNAGDLVQVAYTPGGSGFAAVLSIDGRAAVTLHWPQSGSTWSARLEAAGESMPSAYELDDAPDFERFFLINCSKRFALKTMLAAAEKLARADPRMGKLKLSDDCRVSSVRLKKGTP